MVPRLGSRMRSRLGRFPGNVSEPLCLRATIFVMDIVYGMLASGSVMLTDIGRQLGERISLEHTEKRLSRNLAREELAPVISTALCREAVAHVQRDTLVILDPTDISKPYARKMQYLATIRDGSAKRLTEGYWMVSVVAAEASRRRMILIWGEVFSQESPEFISENEQLLRAVRTISKATEGRGIWVIDRGGDRGRLFQELSAIEEAFRFIEQAYDIENIRVLTFDRIPNLVSLLMLAVYFVAVLLSGPYRVQLAVLRLVERGKPLFGMPEMALYALARGLATLFSRHPRAPRPRRTPPPAQPPYLKSDLRTFGGRSREILLLAHGRVLGYTSPSRGVAQPGRAHGSGP